MDEIKTWFTSDLHLGHERIVQLSNRPFVDVDEMNFALIERWNARVSERDTVYILGDLVMGKFVNTIELVRLLKGRKFLVPGNHDRVSPAYNGNPKRIPEWKAMYEDVGLFILPPQVEHQLGDLDVVMCHFPYDRDDLDRRDYDAFLPVDDGRWLLHGHVHERYETSGRQVNVGVDVHDYAPISEDEVLAIIAERY